VLLAWNGIHFVNVSAVGQESVYGLKLAISGGCVKLGKSLAVIENLGIDRRHGKIARSSTYAGKGQGSSSAPH
jgi:hypothetical protein